MDTSKITAADIMTRRLAVTTPDTHVFDAVERLISQRVSGLPVVDRSGNFLGRFSERTAIAALDLTTILANSRVATQMTHVCAADIVDRSGPVLKSSQDVFESAGELIAHKVSGAPVIDPDGTLRGIFSEQSAMHVFIGLCWEQLPSSQVTAWLDRSEERKIDEHTGLGEILDRFQNTPFRRLMVMHGPKLIGQITRLNALQAALEITREPMETSRLLSGGHQIGSKATVQTWMQREAVATTHDADVLGIAQLFLRSAARQLPVLDGQRLDGQISRSDLLRAIQRFFPDNVSSESGVQTLYLTSVHKRDAYSVMK
ncbi:MAG: CBS domain-containing protein [Fuerstiella sp.]